MSIGRTYFKVKKFQIKEQFYLVKRYYNSSFMWKNLLCILSSFFINPYKVARKHHRAPFGETPISTWEKLAKEAKVSEKDIVCDLGSGRGVGILWLCSFFSCKSIGVETIPVFVHISKWIKRLTGCSKSLFLLQDYFEFDFSNVTVVYLYGTTLSEKEIEKLIDKFRDLPKEARVISISFPLKADYLKLEKNFPVIFPWGKTNAYIQKVKDGTVI